MSSRGVAEIQHSGFLYNKPQELYNYRVFISPRSLTKYRVFWWVGYSHFFTQFHTSGLVSLNGKFDLLFRSVSPCTYKVFGTTDIMVYLIVISLVLVVIHIFLSITSNDIGYHLLYFFSIRNTLLLFLDLVIHHFSASSILQK